MALDMYLDSDYAELIFDINKLKIEVAEKIVERDWLSNYVFPEIKYNYNLKLGANEAELFLAKINLNKIKRKIFIYKEYTKYNNEIDEDKIDAFLDKELKNEIHEYTLMQEGIKEAIEFTHKDRKTKEYIDNLNYLYKKMIIKLCPLINLKNTRLENMLYYIVEDAYKNANINKILGVNLLCEKSKINNDLYVDDFDNLLKLKKIYTKLLEENKCIILNIRSSEMFSNRTILNDEILLRRKKYDINSKIEEISREYTKLLKELEKLRKKR